MGVGFNVRTRAVNADDSTTANRDRYSGANADADPDDEVFYSNTLYDSGSSTYIPYTWTTMIQTVWGNLPEAFGSSASLDLTQADFPSAPPENYKFNDISAWEVLNQILDSIFHTVIRKLDGTWMIVSPKKMNGVTDSPRGMMQLARDHLLDSLNVVENPKLVFSQFAKRNGSSGAPPTNVHKLFGRRNKNEQKAD